MRRRSRAPATAEVSGNKKARSTVDNTGWLVRKWNSLSKFQRHWAVNVALGVLIELAIHIAGHTFHFAPVVKFQNWGLDVVTRLSEGTCSWAGAASGLRSAISRTLNCPQSVVASDSPILLNVDDETWRNKAWGGGEPDRAPRNQVATLIDRAFRLGAEQVVLDILIADRSVPVAILQSSDTVSRGRFEEDAQFAESLRALLVKPYFGKDRKLVLVRSERQPVPASESGFLTSRTPYLPEMRSSSELDAVIAESGGRIVVAAPYFEVGLDRVVRDWVLFKAMCQRVGPTGSSSKILLVPSVQLVTTAHRLGLNPEVVSPSMGTDFVNSSAGQHSIASIPTLSNEFGGSQCKPFALSGAAELNDAEGGVHECELDLALHGAQVGASSSACTEVAKRCNAAGDSNPDWAKGDSCKPLAAQLRDSSAKNPGFASKIVRAMGLAHANDGIFNRYWHSVQTAFEAARSDPPLADLPHEGGLGNRVLFRYPPDGQGTTNQSALPFLLADGTTLQAYAQAFKGRIVVVGQTFSESRDFFETPLGHMSGAMVLVNAIDSMAKHRLMQPPSTLLTFFVSFVLILIVGYLFAKWDSTTGTTLATIAVIVTAGVASFFLFAHGVWLDFAAPIIGIQIHRRWADFEEKIERRHREKLDHKPH